jgi:thiamine biosynthesis lipoprotein
VTLSCEHMATTISVTVRGGERSAEAGRIVSEVFAGVDRDMSEWKPGSPLTAVNEAAGVRPVEVPRDLLAVVERGLALGEATGGAFDVTWAALWGLWDFRAASPVVPEAAEIERRAALVDFRRVEIDRDASTIYLPEAGMKMGLGGIAKGYALDEAARRLRAAGFTDFMIVAGGQVHAAGTRGDRAWRVGVREPRGAIDELFAVVEAQDVGVSTSGDYERFFVADGERYHHVLDPRTGWPSVGPRSVTVASPDATLADAMSTALMIVAPERREAVMEAAGIGWALVVERDGRVVEVGSGGPPISWIE